MQGFVTDCGNGTGLPPETSLIRMPEDDCGMPLFMAYPDCKLVQFLPDKGFLESVGHDLSLSRPVRFSVPILPERKSSTHWRKLPPVRIRL